MCEFRMSFLFCLNFRQLKLWSRQQRLHCCHSLPHSWHNPFLRWIFGWLCASARHFNHITSQKIFQLFRFYIANCIYDARSLSDESSFDNFVHNIRSGTWSIVNMRLWYVMNLFGNCLIYELHECTFVGWRILLKRISILTQWPWEFPVAQKYTLRM